MECLISVIEVLEHCQYKEDKLKCTAKNPKNMVNLFTMFFACGSNRHFKNHLNTFKLISKGFKCVLSMLETFK
jgi:hypothetical protein